MWENLSNITKYNLKIENKLKYLTIMTGRKTCILLEK